MRNAILDAARGLIAQEGVQALSMRAIARDIGYSPAALYEYFPSKERVCCALYFEGAEGLAGRMRAALDGAPDATAAERLELLAHAYRRYALEQPELYQLAFGGAVAQFTPSEDEIESGKEAFGILVTAARAGIATGEFADLPAEAIAIACWSGVHGFVMLEIGGMLGPDKASSLPGGPLAEHVFAATLAVLERGFVRR